MQKITCTYGDSCFISVEQIDNQYILKIDFNIKKYQVCKHGWRDYDFPPDIVINDKLYLDLETKDKVIKILNGFIKTGEVKNISKEVEDAPLQFTIRGWGFRELKDLKGNTISIQESSSGEEAKIWFGCRAKDTAFVSNNGKLENYVFPPGDVMVSDRLHLNKKIAKQLKDAIKKEWEMVVLASSLEEKGKDKPRQKI